MRRCSWCSDDEVYQEYHDNEWGVPVYDDKVLFEFLILEGAQAGLSWITILKRREGYARAFDSFDFEKVAKYDDGDFERLVNDSAIIRNRLKIRSAIGNAKIFIKIREEFGSFSEYLWGFTNGEVVVGDGKAVTSELSDEISKDLKRRGMKFVGSVIVYAYLQAVGVVSDHEVECFLKKG